MPTTPSKVADIMVVPGPTALTKPPIETVATVAAAELHANAPPATAAPLTLVALADSWTVSPTEFNVAVPGDTETVATESVVLVGESVFAHETTKPTNKNTTIVRRTRDESRVWVMIVTPDAGLLSGDIDRGAHSDRASVRPV